ncbi:MAG: AmpG family muropeptide MFS transporter [Planctomycetes bacterium]|nr:AmpG family muropeptide MFS transporter [Planctomycetota bacterium]
MPSTESPKPSRNHWTWIPSLYFAEGLPYVMVMIVSVIMYKNLGVSNTKIALYTSWLYLPWVIKPFWSPLVDVLRSKRWWIVAMQLLIGAGLAGVALTIPTSGFLQYTLMFLWLLAFSSATHDIAADGFYMIAMSSHDQAWFVGIRSTFYRLAMIVGQGVLVMVAGLLESQTGLADLELRVQAAPDITSVAQFLPKEVEIEGSSSMELLAHPVTLQIGVQPRDADEVQTLLAKVREWNISHNFYGEEATAKTAEKNEKAAWLTSLENSIRTRFGPSEPPAAVDNLTGNVGVFYLGISQSVAADTEVVVNLQKTSGSNDIRLLEGDRFTITENNCDFPMAVLVQLDRKLTQEVTTVFSARSGNSRLAWVTVCYLLAGLFLVFGAYHAFALPRPEQSDAASEMQNQGFVQVFQEFLATFASFFRKPRILTVLAFLLIYRFSEAQLAKMAAPFLLDSRQYGGLSLTTTEVGFVYGTIGIVMLTLGGILGGLVAAKRGLKFWLGWMVIAINLPNAVYVFLSQVQPESYWAVNLAVGIEQFGYGFGFTAYMLYMLYIAQGEHQTAHYAICTGFMALGMMIPGMMSGWLQELIGYQHFFLWVMLATIPSFFVCWLIPLDAEFGKKTDEPET